MSDAVQRLREVIDTKGSLAGLLFAGWYTGKYQAELANSQPKENN